MIWGANEFIEGTYNRIVKNEEFAPYYLVKWAGVDPNSGHELIYDENGNKLDAEILSDDEFNSKRQLLSDKTPYPDIYGGLSQYFSYKNIDLGFLIYFQFGNWLLDLREQTHSYISSSSNASPKLKKGWTADNPSDIPLLWESKMADRVTDRYLQMVHT